MLPRPYVAKTAKVSLSSSRAPKSQSVDGSSKDLSVAIGVNVLPKASYSSVSHVYFPPLSTWQTPLPFRWTRQLYYGVVITSRDVDSTEGRTPKGRWTKALRVALLTLTVNAMSRFQEVFCAPLTEMVTALEPLG